MLKAKLTFWCHRQKSYVSHIKLIQKYFYNQNNPVSCVYGRFIYSVRVYTCLTCVYIMYHKLLILSNLCNPMSYVCLIDFFLQIKNKTFLNVLARMFVNLSNVFFFISFSFTLNFTLLQI